MTKTRCQGKKINGQPCSRKAKSDSDYCWQHQSDKTGTWRELYEHLENATPEERMDIVLGLIEAHPEGKLELPIRKGVRANLSYVDLSTGTLKARYVRCGNEFPSWWNNEFQGVHLFLANLQEANLGNINLQGANLGRANLYEAKLWDANFQGANLRRTNLQGAKLWLANLQGTDLFRTNLQGAELGRTNFKEADLGHANLQGASLYDANLQRAKLKYANLQKVNMEEANLQEADLRSAKLQGVNLLQCKSIAHIYIGNAWLDQTRLRYEQLGGAIGEELDAKNEQLIAQERAEKYADAKYAYLALKQNFDSLGDYNASSWAYIKERKMEKLEAQANGHAAFSQHRWRDAFVNYAKSTSDQIIEWLSLYGEGPWRVILSLVMVWFGFALIYGLIYGVWGPWQETATGKMRDITLNPLDLLSFSLGAMVTQPPEDLEARSILLMRVLMPLEALLGIFLAGLFGFVVGNRIRRS